MKTPVNSIEIPPEFVQLASEWYDGSDSMLYAIASTGNLTTGTRRPRGVDTDEEWYQYLWSNLECELSRNIPYDDDLDIHELIHFQRYAEEISDRLYEEYGIEAIEDARRKEEEESYYQ